MPGFANLSYSHFRLESFDRDQLKEVIDGAEAEHTLMPGGRPHFEHQRLTAGGSTLESGSYGSAILAQGRFPRQRFTMGFLMEGKQPAYTSGHIIRRHSVQLYAQNEEIHYRAAPETTWVICTVDPETLQQSALKLTGRPLPFPRTGCVSFDTSPEAGRRLAATFRGCFAAGARATKSSQAAGLAERLEEQLHYDIAIAVHGTQLDSRSARIACSQARRNHIARRAEEYLRAHLTEPFRLAGLAEATGTSARMVEYYFRDIYDLTPLQWFRSKKLNRVREELMSRDRSDTRVTDIALAWGISHLSRFSADYHRLFGENPSETLRRRA